MSAFDMPLDSCGSTDRSGTSRADFDAFWAATLRRRARRDDRGLRAARRAALRTIEPRRDVHAASAASRIKGWLLLPAGAPGRCRSSSSTSATAAVAAPDERLVWAARGLCAPRHGHPRPGQRWSRSATRPTRCRTASEPHPGFMTRGILDPPTYYYRRLITDAVRAVDAVQRSGIDHATDRDRRPEPGRRARPRRRRPRAAMSAPTCLDVPFLCHYRRAAEITDEEPYGEIVRYLRYQRDRLDAGLPRPSPTSTAQLRGAGAAPALFSVGLMDDICPPSTVFAAYNHYARPARTSGSGRSTSTRAASSSSSCSRALQVPRRPGARAVSGDWMPTRPCLCATAAAAAAVPSRRSAAHGSSRREADCPHVVCLPR